MLHLTDPIKPAAESTAQRSANTGARLPSQFRLAAFALECKNAAADARRASNAAISVETRDFWATIATQWEQLAKDAERSTGAHPV